MLARVKKVRAQFVSSFLYIIVFVYPATCILIPTATLQLVGFASHTTAK